MFLDIMDVAFGHMDGRVEASLADSTMMWIVHYAMNKAQERMKTKTGVIERLNEISKFYELAVMQLEGCLNIVHAETESSLLERNHAEVLDELREIKNRLQGRLEESELAISEKDRELMELKEREPVSLGASHEIETTTDHNADESDQTRRNKHDKGDDIGELRTCMDQRMLNIKKRLEPKRDMLGEVPRSGIDRKKIEEMGSDIEILKQTMDLAFAKMQSALLLCEMRPKERQWKLKIEKDIMSILIKSSMREFQENVNAQERKKDESQVLKCWQEHWPQMMNEVTFLQHELATLNETCAEDSDCSALSSPTKTSALSSPTKASAASSPTKASQEEGSYDKRNRFSQKLDEVDDEENSQKEGENEDGGNVVAKLIKNHESIIRQKKEEVKRSKHGISQDKKASSSRKRKERLKERIRAVTERLDSLTNRNAQMSESLFNQKAVRDNKTLSRRNSSEVKEIDTVRKDFDYRGSALEKEKGVSDSGNEARQEKRTLTVEKRYNTMPSSRAEDIHGSLGEGLVQELESKSYCSEIEMLVQLCVYKYYLREVIDQWNEGIERNIIERKISDDIYSIFFSEVAKDNSTNQELALTICQSGEGKAEEHCLQFRNQEDEIESTIKEDICMLIFRKTSEEFNMMMVGCNVDSIVREEIHWIVFTETLKDSANIATCASKEHMQSNMDDNFLDQLQVTITESLLKEDVYMVVFKAMVKEWKLELDSYYMENFITEQIHQVIMVETLSDALLLSMEVKSQVQYNTVEDNSITMMLNHVIKSQGQENLTTILLDSLLRCFEAEENLMLSAQSEINEHSKQLDLGSERGDLHEHEIFEDLITGEEQTFSSLTSKVENLLQQLGISKALLIELGTSLGHSLRNSERVHDQVSTNEEEQLNSSSAVFLPLLNLSQTFSEFEGMVCQRIEIMTWRLEKMKCCLDPVIELFNCLRSKELLYQKAFVKRCQNLQKAEAEVDLLGDQVDALLTLLERIYVTLDLHAPALQQHFEVSNILELIKAELTRGTSQTARVVT